MCRPPYALGHTNPTKDASLYGYTCEYKKRVDECMVLETWTPVHGVYSRLKFTLHTEVFNSAAYHNHPSLLAAHAVALADEVSYSPALCHLFKLISNSNYDNK